MNKIFLGVFLAVLVMGKDPVVLSGSYQQYFDQSYYQQHNFTVNGQLYYDADHGRGRIDRSDGRFDVFCGSVMPGVITPCTNLVVDGKRYIYYPRKRSCCFCCDEAHGCGVTPKDYFADASYVGQEKIVTTLYDKWEKVVSGVSILFYVTTDSQIPRRIFEGTHHVFDYNILTFKNMTFPDELFDLPSYCDPEESCPLSTNCGKLRLGLQTE